MKIFEARQVQSYFNRIMYLENRDDFISQMRLLSITAVFLVDAVTQVHTTDTQAYSGRARHDTKRIE